MLSFYDFSCRPLPSGDIDINVVVRQNEMPTSGVPYKLPNYCILYCPIHEPTTAVAI